MFALYFALLFVPATLVVLHVRDRVLNNCVDRLLMFNSQIDINLAQAKKFDTMGLGNYSQFYRDQIVNIDSRIKWEARLYKALI